MKSSNLLYVLLLTLLVTSFYSCRKDKNSDPEPAVNTAEGVYTSEYTSKLDGFFEQRQSLLEAENVELADFIRISTDSSWSLSETERAQLKNIRDNVDFPIYTTLLQKTITYDEMDVYISNKYGGTVGGFVCAAGDVKTLHNLNDVYWGLRLDYPGTDWDLNGSHYAIIRYTVNCVHSMYIPYSPEMGGSYAHQWPNTGGGFTSSTLGDGGFPEYTFTGYHSPNEGGEIYSVTADGTETLEAKFENNQWVAVNQSKKSDFVNPVRNGIYARYNDMLYETKSLQTGEYKVINDEVPEYLVEELVEVKSFASYKGETFYVRGCDGVNYYLTTTDAAVNRKLPLRTIEKGMYQIVVPMENVDDIWEEYSKVTMR